MDEKVDRVFRDPWTVVDVDHIEPVDWRRMGLRWLPVRQALGAEMVGLGAHVGAEAGDLVVEPHVEAADGRGHQEVYLVVRGIARFLLDGVEVIASAGTFIRVEPAVHRHAVAGQAGTLVLAMGGEPSYTPSASEWIERARPHVRDDPQRAQDILADLRQALPDDRANDVGEALLAEGEGNPERAMSIVQRCSPRRRGSGRRWRPTRTWLASWSPDCQDRRGASSGGSALGPSG